jgi:phosphoacetylglucosamine mutase
LHYFAEAEHRQAAKRLVAVNEMVNQAVGDALSGILMVEVVLRYQGWSVEQWDSMYKDLPSRQLKVKVKDRAVIITTPDETRVASPSSLQEAIDTEVGKLFFVFIILRTSSDSVNSLD